MFPRGMILSLALEAGPVTLGPMKQLWNSFFGPEAEAKRMRRDVNYILGELTQGHYGPVEDWVATDLRKDLNYVKATFIERDEHGHARAEDHFKRMHKEARRRASQRDLTVLTLAIIYVKADAMGQAARDIVEKIDAFLSEWAHLVEDDDDGSATGASRPTPYMTDGGAG